MALNPFRSLPNPRQVWAWGMYDLANQSFTLLVVTLFLPIYLEKVVLPAGAPPGRAEALLGYTVASASAVMVATSPFLGALADFSGMKKRILTWTAWACSILTVALALTGPGDTALVLALYASAFLMYMYGESFLASFLPEISTRETRGRVSAIGWTMGYIGALLCLPLSLLLPGMLAQTPAGFRNLFIFAGLWFLLNAVPTFFILKEAKTREAMPAGATIWTIGFLRVLGTVREAGRYRDLAVFLASFGVYCCGMQVIIVFSGLLASRYIPHAGALIAFVLALALISAVGSAISGVYQDRIGQRLTVQISLGVWIATAIGAVLLPASSAAWWHLGLVGAGVGLGLGLTGAASRALVGVLTPVNKTAEFFALWGLCYRAAGAVGPFLFGVIYQSAGQQWAMALVLAFFIIGLAGTFFVNVDRGSRSAEVVERRFERRTRPVAGPNR